MLDILTIILILEFFFLAFAIWMAWTGIVGAPWLPTPKQKVREMLELADVTHEDIVYDLGSGDGRIVIMAAKEFGAQSVGIEIDPIRLRWSRFRIKRNKVGHRAKVIRANFLKMNLEDATVITIYGGIKINEQIKEKLENDLKSGTRVVSYFFKLEGWIPAKTREESSLFLYIK
jgi:precorrin-6B methylase 2